MGEICFLSDLHLLARRSTAARYMHAIRAAAARSTAFVLGGDIFDFRWATTRTPAEAVDWSVRWLYELVSQFPKCHFHYLLGNHDYHQPLMDRLAELDGTLENLSWHRYCLRLGDCVFLHGDVAERYVNAETLATVRSKWLHVGRSGPIRGRLYDLLVGCRMHKALLWAVFPRRRVARRILTYLNDTGHGPEDGVRGVYFGHTHRAMADYRYGGLSFHNGGAAIRGMKFQILQASRGACPRACLSPG